jgi:hypothetical protein
MEAGLAAPAIERQFAYIRANGKERLLVVLNPTHREVSASFPLMFKCQKPKLILGEETASLKENTVSMKMNPVSYAIFQINEVK